MKLLRSIISTHGTRLTVIGAVALIAALSVSAAKLAAGQTKAVTTVSTSEPQELLRDIAAPKTETLSTPATPHVHQIMMEVTAYCPCAKCCGPKAQGITASGKLVTYNAGRFVAADRSMPFGTKLIVPGYHNTQPVEVLDRGGAIKGNKLDVFFPTHKEALKWGRQHVLVTVVD